MKYFLRPLRFIFRAGTHCATALCIATALTASVFAASGARIKNNAPGRTPASSAAQTYVKTPAYTWTGDSIIQGPFKAWAPSDFEIISDYHATPGYFMPVEQRWARTNDLSDLPVLTSGNTLYNAVFNMGLDEMINAIEPDSTLRTGREWPGVWTRDVSYSIILAMAALQPEVSRISLEHKISSDGRIIQDTGSGGAWPVSSDRQIWTIAAFEIYKVTGSRSWLEKIYPVVRRSLDDDYNVVYDPATGLIRGETSFIDWREQSYPRWMQTADIYASESLGTSVIHAQAWRTAAEMARLMGDKKLAATYTKRADDIAQAINSELWLNDKGYYAMYLYGRDFPILNPRAEALGEALAILYDVADEHRAKIITEKFPVTPFGPPVFYPQIADMPPYHNNALWPFVAAYWTLANAKAGNADGAMLGFGSIIRPAALFCTNKENLNLDNGDISTELNSSNMLWSLSGNLAITMKMLLGMQFRTDGIAFAPFVPRVMADRRTLNGFRYRNATLNITVEGYGNRIAHFYLNGKAHTPFIPDDIKGENTIRIVMENNVIPPLRVNEVNNVSAPLTPIAWLRHDPNLVAGSNAPVNNLLEWQPIEYINYYKVLRDGNVVAQTNEVSFPALVPGEYQVIGVNSDGIESFASRPMSNRSERSVQVAAERSTITSPEACNVPAGSIKGFNGNGFAEIDHNSAPLNFTVDVPQAGLYSIVLRYANGNGPVNTENKCAIRSLMLNGQCVGTFVMPQRGVGNWSDWGLTNAVKVQLPAGRSTLSLRMLPHDENMNIATNHALVDEMIIHRLRP